MALNKFNFYTKFKNGEKIPKLFEEQHAARRLLHKREDLF